MEVKWALLADAAIDGGGGKLSLIGIFDTIFAWQVPAMHPKLTLAFKLECTSAEYDTDKALKISLLTADGKNIMGLEASLKIARPPAPMLGIENVVELQNVPFPELGDYAFVILIGGDEKYRVPLRVIEVKDDGNKSTNPSD